MTVEELIKLLKGHPPDLRVVVQGYENGFDDVSLERVKTVRIQLDCGTESWEGRHQKLFPQKEDAPISDDAVSALALLRASN
ncbi:MAG: hypothetical protein OXG03_05230 [Gammaproteobacteria bacterium]|nr:hypothetical protein [Gammaproteobacteria bacterium]